MQRGGRCAALIAVILAIIIASNLFSLKLQKELIVKTDPLFNLPLSSFLLLTSVIQLVLLFLLLVSKTRVWAFLLTAWWVFCILFYRILFCTFPDSCPCLGGVSGFIPFVQAHEEELLRMLLFWIFWMSFGMFLFLSGRSHRLEEK